MTRGDSVNCEVGNDPAHVWCAPCRSCGGCLRMKPMPGNDVFTFQPLTGERLTPAMEVALSMMQDSAGQHLAAEVADHYSTLLGLWRRGLARCTELAPHLSWQTQLWIARRFAAATGGE